MSTRYLLHEPTNIGCASAKALGASIATGDIVITMDCDAYPHADWLTALVAVFDDHTVGMAGPRIINQDGSLQTACILTWHGAGHAGGQNRQNEHSPTLMNRVLRVRAWLSAKRHFFNVHLTR